MRPSLQPRKQSLQPNKEADETIRKLHEQNKIGKSKKILYVLIILLIIGIVLLTGGRVEYQHPAGISGNQISGISPEETPHYPHSIENERGTWILIDASKGKYQLVGTNETLETIQPDEPTPTSIITLTPTPTVPTSTATPLPSPIESNIVLLIDASGSTALGDTTGLSSISLIDANALYIVQNIAGDTNVSVVAFGGATAKTGLLSMSSQANKAELNALIKTITPRGGNNPTDIDNGLLNAETLLDSVSGTKEIIILSDGLIQPDGFVQTKNTVLDLKNKDYTMQFVQVLLPTEPKIPNDNYNQLAMTADTQVLLLYPDERMAFVTHTN